MQVASETFDSVVAASGRLGLSSAQTERALTALAQMASKGVVSMEELRQQLGEALPVAMGIAATSLGITVSELDKLVSSGQLLSRDFLPAFGAALRESFEGGEARVVNMALGWERLKNSIIAATQETNESIGVTRALAVVFDGTSRAIDRSREIARETGTATGYLAGVWRELTGTADKDAGATQRFSDASFEATAQARQAVVDWTRAGVSYADVAVKTAAATAVAVKLTAAKKLEGDAAQRLAELGTDEATQRLAATNAAGGNVAASQRLLLARQGRSRRGNESDYPSAGTGPCARR